MKKFFVLLFSFSFLLHAQKEISPITVGASFGMLSEMGSIQSEGFNAAFDLNVSKYVTDQVAVSANFTFGSAKGVDSPTDGNFDASFNALSMNLLYHIIQLKKAAFYIKGGVGLMGFDGNFDAPDNAGSIETYEYDQGMFSKGAFMIPAGLGVKYKISQNIQGVLDLSMIFPTNSGLDNYIEANKNEGFSTFSLGMQYTFGVKNSDHAEWANPVDVVSSQVKAVEEEVSNLSIDTDGDGVADKFDKENNTPEGVSVDGSGKALDVDADGVPDYKDVDPFTSPGVAVDSSGRELDDDEDGVPNSKDEEPNSPAGCTVNFQGRQIVGKGAFLPTVYFDLASSEVSYSNYQRLATVASVLKANPGYKLRVIGFADSVGASENNYKLGLKRANAVIESLINIFSIDINRMIADSQGENNLLADEQQKMKFQVSQDGLSQTKGFRSLNRRVEFIIE